MSKLGYFGINKGMGRNCTVQTNSGRGPGQKYFVYTSYTIRVNLLLMATFGVTGNFEKKKHFTKVNKSFWYWVYVYAVSSESWYVLKIYKINSWIDLDFRNIGMDSQMQYLHGEYLLTLFIQCFENQDLKSNICQTRSWNKKGFPLCVIINNYNS